MLPNLLQCKCLQEARYLAYPRVTLVLLYPLPASTQTRAQTALHPKTRYCTRPCSIAFLTGWVLACVFFLKSSCVPLSCRQLCSQDDFVKREDIHSATGKTSAPTNHSCTMSVTDTTSAAITLLFLPSSVIGMR